MAFKHNNIAGLAASGHRRIRRADLDLTRVSAQFLHVPYASRSPSMNAPVRAAMLALMALQSAAAQPRGAAAPQPAARRPVPDPFRFQLLGPSGGGRFSAITGVPGDARTWYVGSASGGVWKSSDSGSTFRPVSDSMPVQAIGALAVAPSSPTTVWAGTGEAWAIREADVMGDGIYKSTDSRATWVNMG